MLIKKVQEYMRLRDYSPRTIQAYCNCAKLIYQYFKKPLNKISEQEFKDFLSALFEKNYSSYTINQYHAALKLVFTKIYKILINLNPVFTRFLRMELSSNYIICTGDRTKLDFFISC